MKRRILAIIIAIALLITILPQLTLPAAAADTSGQCGDNLYWSFDESTGKLTITGSGPMDDYVYYSGERAPWADFKGKIQTVYFGEGPTSIGFSAFSGCSNLRAVAFPGTLTTISAEAFYGCTNLWRVVIPETVQSIGQMAFAECTNMTEAWIMNPDCTIDVYFNKQYHGDQLQIDFIDTFQTGAVIHGYKNSTAEEYVNKEFTEDFNHRFAPIDSSSDPDYGLIGISMPTAELRRWSQDGNDLKNRLESMGYGVDLRFAGNDIDLQISQIGDMIDNGAKLLIIAAIDGYSLETVLNRAKRSGVRVIAYDRQIMNTDAVDYCVTFDNRDVGRKQGEYIRDTLGLDSPGGRTFNIEFITGDYYDSNVYDFYSFYNGAMSVLQKYLDNGTLICRSGQTEIQDVATENWSTENAQSRFENILSTYYADQKLDAVLASNDTTAQGVAAALKTSYSNSTYPLITGQDCDIASVRNILYGKQAMSVFKGNGDLSEPTAVLIKTITNGLSLPSMLLSERGNGTINVPTLLLTPKVCTAANVQELLIDSGYYTWENLLNQPGTASGICGDNLYWSFDESTGNLSIIGSGKMTYPSDPPWYSYRRSIRSVSLPLGLTNIGKKAFCATLLTEAEIPDTVARIDDYAFQECENLQNVNIPYGVTHIGKQAFLKCPKLSSIMLPSSIKSIGDYAFDRCGSLQSVRIPQSVTSIGVCPFGYGSNLTSLTVDIRNAWYCSENDALMDFNKTRLIQYAAGESGSFQIPETVTTIGEGAFSGCKNLTSIYIPAQTTSIEHDAFWHCYGLTDVYYGGHEASWNRITIGENNDWLNCNIIFNFTEGARIYSDRSSVKINRSETETVTFTADGFLPDNYHFEYDLSACSCVACSWGEWSGRSCPLYITSLTNGTGTIRVSLCDDETGDILDSVYIDVEVLSSYKVTYVANGGTGAPTDQTKTAGVTLLLGTETPTKSYTITFNTVGSVTPSAKKVDCTFRNWNTELNGGGTSYNPGAAYTADENVTLYAQWTNPIAGTLPTPTRGGYTFDGWYTSSSGGSPVTSATTVTGNMTIYAHWTSNTPVSALDESDIFSFNNSDIHFRHGNYYLSDQDFRKMAAYVKDIYWNDPDMADKVINNVQNYRASDWGGSCYGMSVVTMLDKSGAIGFNENFDPSARTMHQVRSPSQNSQIESAINYYQVSWYIPYLRSRNAKNYNRGSSDWKAGLKQLVSMAQQGKPILFSYWTEYLQEGRDFLPWQRFQLYPFAVCQ